MCPRNSIRYMTDITYANLLRQLVFITHGRVSVSRLIIVTGLVEGA